MTYKIRILETAREDLDWLRKNDRTSYVKCFDLVREVMNDPRSGTGKPERLRYFEKEVYSEESQSERSDGLHNLRIIGRNRYFLV